MTLSVFPVQNVKGVTFYDSFGEPRNNGRTHQGIDIFAPIGTYLYAVSAGTVKQATDPLGGTVLMLTEPGGDRYYYAHLSEYVGKGGSVKKGDIIGRVGVSGDAKGTNPHLHFEYHPGGGPAVDPYGALAKGTRLDHGPRPWGAVAAVLGLFALAFGTFFVYKDR